MKVSELIERLQQCNPDATVCKASESGYGWDSDIDSVVATTRKVGILNPVPRDENIVVLGTGSEGL